MPEPPITTAKTKERIMARAGEEIYEWDKQPRMPVPPPPPRSCDCQFHIYASPQNFPPRPNPPYPPIESATFAQAQRMHRAIGFERGVIVHSAIYGSDHRLLLHALESLDDRDRYRGIGIVDDGVSGWHARLHVNGDDLLNNSDLLRSLKDVPMVIDHFGHVGFEGGMERPVIRWVLDILKQENWWMMISNGNRDSRMEVGWDDASRMADHSSKRRRNGSSGTAIGRTHSGPSE